MEPFDYFGTTREGSVITFQVGTFRDGFLGMGSGCVWCYLKFRLTRMKEFSKNLTELSDGTRGVFRNNSLITWKRIGGRYTHTVIIRVVDLI